MKIKAQIAMVLNLDKCLGCHTCSIPCKNAWTTAPGSEYMWFNNVETKPGIGYPKKWENQKIHKGGWKVHKDKLKLVAGGKGKKLTEIFANPDQPTLDQYYEPYTFDYQNLTTSPKVKHQPTARAYSSITGKPMTPEWGPNWEDDLGGAHVSGLDDPNFEGLDAKDFLQFKKVFMMHLPRLCEHCLNPACVASCPSGAMYKRDEDGIVLVDQTRCRSWRYCVSGCPYKKTYFNWKTHHSEKCLFCYPRVEAGLPTLCAHSCVGRIRYMGVMLYDADQVHQLAASPESTDLYEAHLSLFLDPHDPEVIRQAEADGIPFNFMEAARLSPVRKLICDWRLALPLHPEFRTMPMVWYVPPASPLTAGGLEDVGCEERMRIPVRFLANLFTAGDEKPVRAALAKLLAMRQYMKHQGREKRAAPENGTENPLGKALLHASKGHKSGAQPSPEQAHVNKVLHDAGLSVENVEQMYRLLALARYNERFVIPTVRREDAPGEDVEALKGHAGYPSSVSSAAMPCHQCTEHKSS